MSNNNLVNNRKHSYSRSYKVLHWVLATLFMLMLFAIIGFANEMTLDEKTQMLVVHSSLGSFVGLLVLFRIYKRFIKKDAIPEQDIAPIFLKISKSVQYAFYFFMVFVPVTGHLTARFHELPVMLVGQFNLSQVVSGAYSESSFLFMRQFHEFGTRMFLLLIVLHVGGALFHKLVKKDGVLKSMTTGSD